MIAFLATPQGLALIGSLMTEAPELVGKIIAIWAKKGLVNAEEIANFIASWKDTASFYATPPVPPA